MENPIIAALGALGAWLLVAGPLYQAATELRDQGLTQRRALPDTIAPSQPISPWWWLIPPVAYWRHHRERTRIKREVIGVMSTEEVQRMLHSPTPPWGGCSSPREPPASRSKKRGNSYISPTGRQ